LFHDVGADITREVLLRLKYSNQVLEATVAGVAHHMEFSGVQQMRVATLKRFMARDTFADELELHQVACASSHGRMDNYEFLVSKLEEFAGKPIIPKPFLTGHDLIELGVKPGPEMGDILTEAQDLQLEGAHTSREQALAWLKNTN